MPLLLRAINKAKWFKVAWLEEGKAQADALSDLRPKENKLSFWHVEDNKSNLAQVAAAIAAGREVPDKFDYALFDQSLLEQAGVAIEQTAGDSFHKEADENWHRDAAKLSAEKVAVIANIIMGHGFKGRIQQSEITRLVRQVVASGVIDVNPLKDRLNQKNLPNWLE